MHCNYVIKPVINRILRYIIMAQNRLSVDLELSKQVTISQVLYANQVAINRKEIVNYHLLGRNNE